MAAVKTSPARALAYLARDDGFIPIAIALGLLLGGSAVAIGKGVNDVNNASMVMSANEGLETQMDEVIKRTEGATDPRSQDANEKAKKLKVIAGQLRSGEFKDTVAKTENISRDVAVNSALFAGGTTSSIPLQLASDIGDAATVKSFADMDAENFAEEMRMGPDPEVKAYIDRVNSVRFGWTQRRIEEGAEKVVGPLDPESRVEAAIVETKVEAIQDAVAKTTGKKFEECRSLAEAALLDIEENRDPADAPVPVEIVRGGVGGEIVWQELVLKPEYEQAIEVSPEFLEDAGMTREEFLYSRAQSLGLRTAEVTEIALKVDPANAKGAEGQIVLMPEDEEALKAGEKSQAIGQFMSPMGPVPTIVTPGGEEGYVGTFPTIKDAPAITADKNIDVPKKVWQDWWDGSQSSCPFLFAFDGTRFSAVNDIISVSRDPKAEYVDPMLFRASPNSDGTLEVFIREITAEESFIDRVTLSAVDVPDGYSPAVTPGGEALSVGFGRAPVSAEGAPVRDLSRDDGAGWDAFAGGQLEATFDVPGEDAVLLMSVDGFEVDGPSEGEPLFQRPSLPIEAFVDGAWVAAGTVYPREEAFTAAVDLSAFVRDGRVRVRVGATSCHEHRYQLVDSLLLSTAPRGLARVTPLAPQVAGPVADAAALLAERDDRRVHLTPGQTIRFTLPDPGADAYLLESVGWYRPLQVAPR